MNLESPSSSVVQDSEIEDDSYHIFYSPGTGIPSLSNELQDKTNMNDAPIRYQIDDIPEYEETIPFLRRSLRKRKAIQKMPYSLERIKHKQLLEGYDVTSFEENCERIDLPKKIVQTPIGKELTITNMTTQNDYLSDARSQSPIGGSEIITGSRNLDSIKLLRMENHSDNVSSERSSPAPSDNDYINEAEEIRERIMFRGRLLNMKTAYRGVLPKVAWRKSLNGPKKAKVRKQERPIINQRGIAKRKLASNKNNQDETLMKDLIVSDNELDDREFDIYPIKNDALNSQDLFALNKYYEQKYMDDYLSEDGYQYVDVEDDSTSVASDHNTLTLSVKGFSEDNQGHIQDFHGSFKNSRAATSSFSRINDEISAFEDDSHSINHLLSVAKRRNRKPGNDLKQNTKRQPSRALYRHFSRDLQPVHVIQTSKRKVRTEKVVNGKNLIGELRVIDQVSKKNGIPKSETSLPRKTIIKKTTYLPGIQPNDQAELSRRVNVFSTILEAPSEKYASRSNRKRLQTPSEMQTQDNGENQRQELTCEKVLEALTTRTSLVPPDITKITLSGRQYTLSRLDDNGTLVTLRALFDHIIDSGVTDTELVAFCEKLCLFLLYYDRPSLNDVLCEFHMRFRSKVTNLQNKAKPIHFYQIAICQLMFLEHCRCSNISKNVRNEMEITIINNIVSFFELLSILDEKSILGDTAYLSASYEVLSAVCKIINITDFLWKQLYDKKFKPAIFFVILRYFPCAHEKWNLLELNDNYACMLTALGVINFCLCQRNWSVTSDLIIPFYRLFRTKRFENFVEEYDMSKENFVISSCRQDFSCKTIFNCYLLILRSATLSHSLIEKIVPISEISPSDSIDVLINRLNLLITIAENSTINFEKRVDQLVRPILTIENRDRRTQKFLESVCISVLNASTCLLEISLTKKSTFRCITVVSCFKHLVFDREFLVTIWLDFLKRLEILLAVNKQAHMAVLKGLFPCFLLMGEKKRFYGGVTVLLRLYLKNLTQLGAPWVETNLFQCIKKKAHESTNWIDSYCKVAQFLIDKQVMSWWSFFMYNNIQESVSTKLYFHNKIIRLCDLHSFDLIKKGLFSMAVEEMLGNKSPLFDSFLKQLLIREHVSITGDSHCRTEAGRQYLIKRLFFTLDKLSYKDLLSKSVSKIRSFYESKQLNINFVRVLIEYLNTNFVDSIKKSHDFLFLKRELGISDRETDKSSFRDILMSQNNFLRQAFYVEDGLINAFRRSDDLGYYGEKLMSLFTFSILPNPFRFFSCLIKAHLVPPKEVSLFLPKVNVGVFFLKLINDFLVDRFLQVSVNEFIELCKLHRVLCNMTPLFYIRNVILNNEFLYQNMRYQLNILKIADGFWEFELLSNDSKRFFTETSSSSIIADEESVLSLHIDEIVQKNIASCSDTTFKNSTEKINALETSLKYFTRINSMCVTEVK